MSEKINSNKQRILITGVSGLIGRILFKYLTKTYPDKYEVFGLDQHMKVSGRYQADSNKSDEIEATYPLPLDKFFQCDITDRTKLFEIIEQQHIEIIIHLAGVLQTHPDLETISRVNIEGTKNVFEARESVFVLISIYCMIKFNTFSGY
jgi:nucleoside-diphosphate-sugar epimerase